MPIFVGQAGALDDIRGVVSVGIDDTSMHRGLSNITVAHDLDEKRLLFATEGRDHQTADDFAAGIAARLQALTSFDKRPPGAGVKSNIHFKASRL